MKTLTCDSCGKSVRDDEHVACVWTVITLWVPCELARTSKTFDLCPSCQDILYDEIKLGGLE